MPPIRFSVITIVKDGVDFLTEAVASVQGQSVDDWELHIVDDGSTDGTLDLAHDLRREDQERISVHHHDDHANLGMSTSRNLGLHRSRGEFVTWLDHDDLLLPEKLEHLHHALERHPEAVAAIGPNRRWHSWHSPERDDWDQDFGLPTWELLPPPGLVPRFLEDRHTVPLGPLVRRRPLEAFGGHVESFRGMHEDQAFLARMMFRHPVVVVDEILHLYRQHESSCVSTTHRAGRDLEARRSFLRWVDEEHERSGIRSMELRNIIRRELGTTRGWRRRLIRRWLINARNRRAAP